MHIRHVLVWVAIAAFTLAYAGSKAYAQEGKTTILTNPATEPGTDLGVSSINIDFRNAIGQSIDVKAVSDIIYADQKIKVVDLRRMGAHFDNVFSTYLMPYVKQVNFSRPTDPSVPGKADNARLPFQTGFRLCVQNGTFKDTNGTIWKGSRPLEGLNSTKGSVDEGETDPRFTSWYHNDLWSSRYGNAIFNTPLLGAQIPGVDFYTPTADLAPVQDIKTVNGNVVYVINLNDMDAVLYPCDANTDSNLIPNTQKQGEGIAFLGGPGSIFSGFINFVKGAFSGQLYACPAQVYSGTGPTPTPDVNCGGAGKKFKPTDSLSGGVALDCQLNGCLSTDLHTNLDPASRQKFKDSGASSIQSRNGFFSSFKVSAYKRFDPENARVPVEQELSGSRETQQAPVSGVKSIVDKYICLVENQLLPPSYKKVNDFPYTCTLTANPPTTTGAGSCGTTLPNLDVTTPACKLCNTGDLNSYVQRFGYPSLPPTMIKILEKAGETYQVPSSVLLSLLYSEGGLERWQWTEQNVTTWSLCGGGVPNCSANSQGAQGPFQIIGMTNIKLVIFLRKKNVSVIKHFK